MIARNQANTQRLRDAYLPRLRKAQPCYDTATAEAFVDTVVKNAVIVKSDAFKEAAKECGFKPTRKGLIGYLFAPQIRTEDGASTNDMRAAA